MGSLVTGSFATVPGLLLLPYLTDVLAVPAAIAGLLVLLPKAWDVLFNPVAGRISDRAAVRRPFLLAGGIGLAVCFAALFAGPFVGAAASVYVAVVFLVCATAFAFFQVPYIAMLAEITDDYHERTRLMAWRMAFLAVAILVSGAGAPAVRDAVGGASGYRVMGIAVGVLILLGTAFTLLGTAGLPAPRRTSSHASPRELLAVVRECRPFRALLALYVLQAAGTGTLLAGVDYFARLVLRDHQLQTALFACFVAPALLVMPLWQWIGRRRGKRFGIVAASLLFTGAVGGLVAAPVLPVVAVIGLVAVVGIGYAGMQVFPVAMLADVIADQGATGGESRAGLFSGVWTAGETLGLALGPGIYGLVLAFGGYQAGTTGAVEQSDSAVTAALLGFSLIPALLTVVALPFLRTRLLDRKDVVAL